MMPRTDSLSLAVFEKLVGMADVEVALEFFRRYQGQKLYFCTVANLKRRILRKKLEEDLRMGVLKHAQLAEKYGLSIHSIMFYSTQSKKKNLTWGRSLALFNTLGELVGTDNAEEMFDYFAGTGIVLCRLKIMFREERNKRVIELHKKGADISDLASKFDMSYYSVSSLIRGKMNSIPPPQVRERNAKRSRYKEKKSSSKDTKSAKSKQHSS